MGYHETSGFSRSRFCCMRNCIQSWFVTVWLILCRGNTEWGNSTVCLMEVVQRKGLEMWQAVGGCRMVGWSGLDWCGSDSHRWQNVAGCRVVGWSGLDWCGSDSHRWQNVAGCRVVEWSGLDLCGSDSHRWQNVAGCRMVEWSGLDSCGSDSHRWQNLANLRIPQTRVWLAPFCSCVKLGKVSFELMYKMRVRWACLSVITTEQVTWLQYNFFSFVSSAHSSLSLSLSIYTLARTSRMFLGLKVLRGKSEVAAVWQRSAAITDRTLHYNFSWNRLRNKWVVTWTCLEIAG